MPELGEAAFEHAPTAQVVVDDENRVAGVNQAARTMFGLRRRDVGRQLEDLELPCRPLELRPLIDEVRDQGRAVASRDIRWQKGTEEPRLLEVEVSPLAVAGAAFAGVIVSFVDATAQRALQSDLERAQRELETAYAELQSTVEELETTNEELQSTSEELETTSDELRDRTDETLQASSFLASVLSSIQQGVIIVDRALRVVAWNGRATELWGLRGDEVEGEHLLDLDIGIPVQRLRDPLRRVLARAEEPDLELEGHDRGGKPVRLHVAFAPLRNRPDGDEPDGAILLVSAERAG